MSSSSSFSSFSSSMVAPGERSVELPDGRRLGFRITSHSFPSEYAPKEEDTVYVTLCFHGMTESQTSVPFPTFTSNQSAEKHRLWVVAVDRPGYGSSSNAPLNYTYKDFGKDVECLIGDLCDFRTQSCKVVWCAMGHSSGGPCALAAASAGGDSKDRVCAGAVLVASDVEYAAHTDLSDPFTDLKTFEDAILSHVDEFHEGSPQQIGLSTPLELDMDAKGDFFQLRESTKVARMEGILNDYRLERDFWGIDFSKVKKLRVIMGDADPFLSVEHATRYERDFKGAKVEIVKDAGHFDVYLSPESIDRNYRFCLELLQEAAASSSSSSSS